MRKLLISVSGIFLFSAYSSAQLMVSKALGKNGKDYGIGFGLFAFLDIPIVAENQSIRIEVGELSYYPSKGQGFFSSSSGIGGGSIRAGYKYVFSESQAGFYVLPTAGWGGVVVSEAQETEAKSYSGLATAIEGGYSIPVGQNSQLINLGLKYEYDFGSKGVSLQSLGFKVSYSFGFFGNRY